MTILRQFLRLCVAMLFSVFGANMAFSVPMATSDFSYFQAETAHFIQADYTGFTARAPPLAVSNVVVTGGVTVMQGSAFSVHGQQTVAALFGFSVDLNAPNNGVPDNWTRLNPAGAQINAPRGYTTYRTPDGDMVHVSPSGLQYGADPKFGNRVDHVLDHTAPNPNKPTHTVFNAQGNDALALVDEAWTRRGAPDANDPLAFVVDLGRPIGTAGETQIRIVTMTPGGNEIRTAYPWP